MKLSLNWLKDYIDPKLSTDALVERLTMSGLEVEGVESIGKDTVLELEITPNRPDCLNILGLAREIGAITGKTVKVPKVKKLKFPLPLREGLGEGCFLHIENKKDCSRYIGTLIRDAQIKDAPQAMKDRLVSMGLKSINNAVDITNFVMMEMGQPLHAFDFDKLAGGKIVVRRAKAGESIVTLDGVERKLDSSILVIADAQKPVAIAGIMGGMGTQITADTKNILLESAHFDLGLIRRACRSLGLRSDSSYRFERNVSLHGVLTGADRATDLLLQLTGGHLSGRAATKFKGHGGAITIRMNIYDIKSLLGLDVTTLKVKGWLSRLGFKVDAYNGKMGVLVPMYRTDIQQGVDVIEEIARMIGFDRLPSSLPKINAQNIPVDKGLRQIKECIRGVLTAGGVDEIVTHAMTNTKALAKAKMADKTAIRVLNPLSQDQELMRPSMLPSFLQVVATNINRGQKDLRFFEIGKCYSVKRPNSIDSVELCHCEGFSPKQSFKEIASSPSAPRNDTALLEREVLGVLLTGRRSHDWRLPRKDMVDIFDLKGLLEKINRELTPIYFGKVDREVLNNWGIKNQDIYYAEVYLDEIVGGNDSRKFEPISEFPVIVRDVSLSVKKEIPYKNIEDICRRNGGEILKSVSFIEQYLGEKIQPGHKGLVFSCLYQSNTRTLREDEVTTVHEQILKSLTQDLGAIRR